MRKVLARLQTATRWVRTNPKAAALQLSVYGLVSAIGFGIVARVTSDPAPGPTILDPHWEQPAMVVTEAEILAAQNLVRYLRTLPGEGNQGGNQKACMDPRLV